jgi:hypothetical protein
MQDLWRPRGDRVSLPGLMAAATSGHMLSGTVGFKFAGFSGGAVDFSSAQFSRGTVDFSSARFYGGIVSYRFAQFSGGTVDFSNASDWSFPPVFPWTDTPLPGVKLPGKERQTQV